MHDTSRRPLVFAAAALTVGLTWAAASQAPVSVVVASPQSRTHYLAHARIWTAPGVLSPQDILDGPSRAFPYTFAEATASEGIACTFTRPGKDLGGTTLKFLCTTADGHALRLKYWDPEHDRGNREAFSIVAATRLMWALGFDALPALPLNIRCERCPENPMSGDGARATRHFLAELQAFPPSGPLILSGDDHSQGWSWRALDDAIAALPPGPERNRQRTHFDALALLGVFMQHGDRKPEQQALYCSSPADVGAGEMRPEAHKNNTSMRLFEAPNRSACAQASAAIVDVGATFGGAGRTSSNTTAKMDLDEWRRRPVFHTMDHGVCRGDLTISLAAGRDGEGDPIVSEEGRRFLLEQLLRLTPAHVRALFTAARVDELGQRPHTSGGATTSTAVDDWTAAFLDKVRQIEAQRCQPAS